MANINHNTLDTLAMQFVEALNTALAERIEALPQCGADFQAYTRENVRANEELPNARWLHAWGLNDGRPWTFDVTTSGHRLTDEILCEFRHHSEAPKVYWSVPLNEKTLNQRVQEALAFVEMQSHARLLSEEEAYPPE